MVHEFSDAGETRLITRVCWAYYREGLTQEQIADRLDLSRKRVIQLLARGRSNGIVHISVSGPEGLSPELEQALCERYDLQASIVTPAPLEGGDIRELVGAALGDFLSNHLRNGDRIGLGWGGTIHAATRSLRQGSLRYLSVVQLLGGLTQRARFNPFDNLSRFASALGAECNYLPVPMLAETVEQKHVFAESPQVAEVMRLVESLDVTVLTAIDMSERSGALEYGVITREEWQSLKRANVVGDICGHYLDQDGRQVDHSVARRTLRSPFQTLQNVDRRILAAGGIHKAEIVRAALRAKMCNFLITDEALAKHLL
jgi:DNA-binding transcriptional regulator LsrR (DeoR family)